jgi:hypothetical protein
MRLNPYSIFVNYPSYGVVKPHPLDTAILAVLAADQVSLAGFENLERVHLRQMLLYVLDL